MPARWVRIGSTFGTRHATACCLDLRPKSPMCVGAGTSCCTPTRWDWLHNSARTFKKLCPASIDRAPRCANETSRSGSARRVCLRAGLRVPDAIADMDVSADLRASRLVVSAEFAAPSDKGAKGRVGWLVRQLREAPDDLIVEAFARGSKTPEIATIRDLREDTALVLRSRQNPPSRFRVTQRSEMGQARRTTRKLGFADSVTEAIERFYSTTLQRLRKAAPPAPKAIPEHPESAPAPVSLERTAEISSGPGEFAEIET